jgi:O-antigen/teichoic acid export membrane protein
VTSEIAIENSADPAVQIPSTAGMTTKVVKGSLWTLAGQVAPLGVSLITTPFVIRMLGAESYGVLILVGLIPTYLGFAEFGMSLASTKFASEAYAKGDFALEARIVRTAALITLCSSVPIALILFFFSPQIINLFNVPEHLHGEASLALKFAAVTFVLNFLSGIFNTPELTRLRMDLNTFVTSGFRILGLVATPFAVYYYGVVGAVFVLMIASALTLAGHLMVSGWLLSELRKTALERETAFEMIKFGSSLVSYGIAGVLLFNAERGVLPIMLSVEALAYYTVAATVAGLTIMLSSSMIQSLVPAFSRLSEQEHQSARMHLFRRILRLLLLILIPSAVFLALIAHDFIAGWAGVEFAERSSGPFYILLFGLLINIPGYIPYSILMSRGRADVFAKLYWIELIPYLGLVVALTSILGLAGAALAWSLRVSFDGLFFFYICKRALRAPELTIGHRNIVTILTSLVYIPLVTLFCLGTAKVILWPCFVVGTAIFFLLNWKLGLEPIEQEWIGARLSRLMGGFRRVY